MLNQSELFFELIIVDNNSKDETFDLVKKYSKENVKIKYILESKVGLSHARNRGIKESSGDYLAYIDDDCILPKNWMETANHLIDSKDLDFIGGPVFPFYDKKKPNWFKDSYLTFEFGSTPRKLSNNETLIGCNFIFRKSIIEKIGEFRTDLGMKGSQVLYSEETELQLRYINSSISKGILYDPALYLHHYARPDKLSLQWNIKAFIGKGKSNFRTINIQINKPRFMKFLELAIQLFKLAYFFSFGTIVRDKNKYPFYQNYIMEKVQGHLKKYGFLLEQFK